MAKRARTLKEKYLEGQGCGCQLKGYIHTPKPQIQSVEPRKGRLGTKAIPCVLGEEEGIKRLCCVFLSVFGGFLVFGREKNM